MSMLTNQVSLVGNVGANPVARARTRDGKPVVGFAIAQSVLGSEPETGKLVQKSTQWFQVSSFGRLAEKILGSVKKGDLVMVKGELRMSAYTGKEGEKRSAVEIVAFDVCKVERLHTLKVAAEGWNNLGLPTRDVPPGPAFDEWDEATIALGEPTPPMETEA
ncbi:single-stranded DNA-binding protein [Bdellovibrionota bacterium FG-1]